MKIFSWIVLAQVAAGQELWMSPDYGVARDAGTSSSMGLDLIIDDPPLPSVCPAAEAPGGEKEMIPEHVLRHLQKRFEANRGTVILCASCTAEQLVEKIVEASERLGWEAFPTPDYEKAENLTLPEPYVFRTALPIMSQIRCNPNQMPYALFIPGTYEDAAAAIRVIHYYDEDFAILSGGHDYECQSSTKRALLLTSCLDRVHFDFREETVTAGAGVLWSTIYDDLKAQESPYGVMGAQCGLVSVSGYTAGGGYSWHMSRYHGISAENVLQVKVALADGKIVTATRDNKYRDLRWALCGSGGQNLGLILEWKFRLFKSALGGYTHSRVEYRFDDIDEVADSEGGRIYPWSMAREILKGAVVAADALLDKDEIGTVQVRYRKYRGENDQQYSLEINTPCRNLVAVNDVSESCRADEEYQSLIDLKQMYRPFQVRYQYYSTLTDFLLRRTNSYPSTRNSDRGSHFISGEPSTLENVVDKSLEYMDPFFVREPDKETTSSYFSDFNWYGLKDIIKNPELTSINSEAHKASWHVTLRGRWAEESLYHRIKCFIRGWNQVVQEAAGVQNYHGSYINYLDGTADKSSYYGTHLARLLKIKAKYDPYNFFKRVKGIAVNDVDADCLDDICR